MAELYPRWYALRVHTRHEQRVLSRLAERGFEAYLATKRETRWWTDRKTQYDRPLFPGYLFARFGRSQAAQIMQTPGVQSVLGRGADYEPIPDAQIHAVRLASTASQLASAPLTAGDYVTVRKGPFAGTQARVERLKGGSRLTIPIWVMGRCVQVEMRAADVQRESVQNCTPTKPAAGAK